MTITELSIKRPVFITIIFVALGIMGLFAYSRLGTDLLPKMDFPNISVITTYPGAGPEEVEDLISKPVEEAVSGTNQLDNVRSFSYEGYSVVLGQFLLTANADAAAADVQRRVELIKAKLPKDAESPRVVKIDIGAQPILRVSTTSTVLTQTELYQLAKDKLKPRIEATEGVAQVDITGGRRREIKVSVDNNKLKAYGLSITQVSGVLQAQNLDFPTGKITQPTDQYIVRVKGKFTSVDEMKTLPIVTTAGGTTIYLGDVARVENSFNEDVQPTRLNGKEAVGLLCIKQSDANATSTADNMYKVLKELEKEYASDGIKFEIAQDATLYTRASISEVFRDLGIAILLVALVLMLFLRSGKSALIVLVSIPVSLITTGIFMWLFGFTLNLMSLMALALVIGILVDDSIVVLENIHRHMDLGESPVQAAIKGRNEIGFAAIAITLVDVVVFLPISLVSGLSGKIFREFGLTVVSSTLISLLVSFTLTPMLAARFGKPKPLNWWSPVQPIVNFFRGFSNKFERFQDMLERKYHNILAWSLNHRWVILTTSTLLFLGSCSLVITGKIGGEFITQPDRGEFAVNYDFPAGTNVNTADSLVKIYENELAQDKNVARYLTIVGKQENQWGTTDRGNVGQIQVRTLPKEKRIRTTDEEMKYVGELAKKVPGLLVRTSPIGIFGTANQAPLMIEMRGDNMNDLISYTDTLTARIAGIKGLKDLKSSYEEGQPEAKIIFDRDRLSASGMTLGEAALAIRTALAGNTDSKYKEGQTEFDINVIFDKIDRSNAQEVANISLVNRAGQQLKLSDVASIVYGKGPSQINRKNRERVVTLTGGLAGRPIGDVVKDIEKVIAKLPVPKGMNEPYFAGDAENQRKSGGDMGIAFLLAIMFVYMIMVALFESYADPFSIMFSLPVAMIGALVMLWLTGKTLSLFTIVGIIMLMGLVTKNAILIIDRTNARRALGHGIKESLLEAGPTRLRPIIMTTITMILGMTPLALGLGEGSEFRQGMSIAIIGGLTSSMLLTLVLVPVMYTYVEAWREKFPRFFRRILFLGKVKKPRPEYGQVS